MALNSSCRWLLFAAASQNWKQKNPAWQELIKTICFVGFRKKNKTHVELIVDNDFVKNK
jgi:hypothetical protein